MDIKLTEEKILKEHPSLRDKLCKGFHKYDTDTWELIHKTQLDKQIVKEAIESNLPPSMSKEDLKKELGLTQ